MSSRNRIAMLVLVNLDPFSGVMHTPKGTKDVIQDTLTSRMPHYTPMVTLLPDSSPIVIPGMYRKAYVIHVDLDPMPGDMHTEQSAYECVKYVLSQRLRSYKPDVFPAPANLQPHFVN